MMKRRETRLQAITTRPVAAAFGVCAFVSAIVQVAWAETATDQRCAKGGDVRRIEIRLAEDEHLPCKVIYRPEVESDTLGIVSWDDITSLAACVARADEVIERLTVEGWICAEDRDAGGLDDQTVAALAFQGDVPDAGPKDSDTPEEADEKPSLSLNDTPAAPAAADVIDSDQRLGGGDEPAVFVDNPRLPPPSDELATMIRDDLDRLDVTVDGLLEAEIAGYGDLNADDLDDALVLYTYTSPQPAYRQFLAAYMFDGETYQLTATKPVGGHVSATKDARVEAIDGGVVHLTLQSFEPGDASCCPSGTRRLALALRELDLVEIDADAPIR